MKTFLKEMRKPRNFFAGLALFFMIHGVIRVFGL